MNFFVYLHRRKSNNKVFYVGKGTRHRHKSLWHRSQHWKNIVNKHGYTIEIVQNGMQEWWAFELEKELILKYQSHGLCNRTDGGEGASGCVVSEETKKKHKELRADPNLRLNLSKKAKERFANPDFKKSHTAKIKEAMNRPAVKLKLREAAIKQYAKPEAKERSRLLLIKRFSDPKEIEKARLKAILRFNTPEKRSLHAQAKPLRCVNNGKVFGTTTLAAEWVSSLLGKKADNSQIAKACRGIIKSSYGFQWEYIKQPKEEVKPPLVG